MDRRRRIHSRVEGPCVFVQLQLKIDEPQRRKPEASLYCAASVNAAAMGCPNPYGPSAVTVTT